MRLSSTPEINNVSNWVNSDPILLSDLKGNVVMVDFWTWACINCQHVIPYLVDWYERFHDQGLEIIGIHSPEFEYEKELGGVEDAIASYGIEYPVAQDNEMQVWRDFDVHAWPTLFVIDKQGNIRFTHRGEGAYSEIESLIKQLLEE